MMAVVFFGQPVGDLKIIHLADILTSSRMSALAYYVIQALTVVLCLLFVQRYINAGKKKKSSGPEKQSNIMTDGPKVE
jgi:hypothetical protein